MRNSKGMKENAKANFSFPSAGNQQKLPVKIRKL
jgi:hypothetical protein